MSDKDKMSDNKASVVIVYQSPLIVNANFIEQIKAIVVNSNPDIKYDNVSVNAFKKQYTPITSDLVNVVDNSSNYLYLVIFVFLLSVLGMTIYGYAKVKIKNQ